MEVVFAEEYKNSLIVMIVARGLISGDYWVVEEETTRL